MTRNSYGLGDYDDTAQIQRFSEIFSSKFQWANAREKGIFEVTVRHILMWTDKSEKYASDFCSETGYARAQFDQLMSRMFYEWNDHVEQFKKRNP